MADVKISALPASTTPLVGTEVLPIVQSSTTKQVSVANLTAGRAVSALSLTSTTTLGVTGVSTLTGGATIQGLTVGLGANAVASNTAVGLSALSSGSLSGTYNVAMGFNALPNITTGVYNTGVGASTLFTNQGGSSNTAVGLNALYSNLTGGDNTAVGGFALQANTGGGNIGIGYNAGSALTTGSNNTIIGSVTGTAGLSDTVIIAAGSAERMRIDSSGNMTVATGNITPSTAAKGVNFTANTGTAGKTSQLLNWYEEGTFTPTYVSGLTVVGTLTLSGTYTRVGRLVTVFITISSTTSVATGGAIQEICRGLPFTPSSGSATGTVVNAALNSSVGFLFNSVAIYSTGVTTPAASISMTITYFV